LQAPPTERSPDVLVDDALHWIETSGRAAAR
jgi:hypothetical protein